MTAPLRREPRSHVGADGYAKKAYATRKTAKASIRRRRGHGMDQPAYAYRCATCLLWHLGSTPSRPLDD